MGVITRSMSVLAVAPMTVAAATTEPPPPTSAGDSPGLEQMVAMVPATAFELGSTAQLYYVDMSLAWERLGVGTDPTVREENIGQFARVENYTLVPQLFLRQLFQFAEARAEVGFSVVEIEREVAVLSPPDNLFIDATNVPVNDVEAAVTSDPTWSPELMTVDTEFGSYYSWGGDGPEMNLDRISPLRPFGQGGQLAVLGDSLATTIRTLEPAEMEAALATTAGAADSAATSVILAPVLEALDGASVLQLVATATGPMFDPGAIVLTELELEDFLASNVFLEPYLGLAFAEIATPEGQSTEILLVHTDEESASANAEVATEMLATNVDVMTDKPLAELLPGAEVSAEGTIVRVTVPDQGAFRIALDLLQTRSLFPAR